MRIPITILTMLGFPRIELAESVGRRAYLDSAARMRFLKALMPRKPLAELYAAIGYHKHGNTETYRDFLRHLEASEDQFEEAEGDRGSPPSRGSPRMKTTFFQRNFHDPGFRPDLPETFGRLPCRPVPSCGLAARADCPSRRQHHGYLLLWRRQAVAKLTGAQHGKPCRNRCSTADWQKRTDRAFLSYSFRRQVRSIGKVRQKVNSSPEVNSRK
jgi:hypothetical protein